MIQRDIHNKVQQLSKKFPVVTITGPRQAGKTTLAKMAFPGYNYVNLEHPETRTIALEDPKSFFMQYPAPVIIDEIQRAPQLLSYIQVIVDEQKTNGLFILTGSQQLLLNASVSQSLAGRTAMVTLLPFSINEVKQFYKGDLLRDQCIFNGFLPRIFDQNQEPLMAYRNYLHTYVERDVRQLINLKDLYTFEKMLKLLAGRIGQLINLNSLANDTGVSAKTISHWLSVLEASYIIFRLQPFYENFGKRVIKSS
jgi:predicted AAA+ superfamily ATPase